MRLGGLVIVQWRISSPGIYMVFPLISPLFLFLILTVQLLVKVSSVQPVEHSARVLTKDLSLVPTASSLDTWHLEVKSRGYSFTHKQAQLYYACWSNTAKLAGCLSFSFPTFQCAIIECTGTGIGPHLNTLFLK